VLPQCTPTEGRAGNGHDMPPQEGTTAREHELEMLLRGPPIEHGHATLPHQKGVVGTSECRPTQEHPREGAHGPDWPSTEGATERTWLLREVPLEGALTTLEARGTCQPKRKLPWKAIPKPRRPFEARRASVVGKVDCPTRRHLATRKFKSVQQHQQKNWPNTFTHVCTTFPLSRTAISRASYRVLRLSASGQGRGRHTKSPLATSITPRHMCITRIPVPCALATHPCKNCQ